MYEVAFLIGFGYVYAVHDYYCERIFSRKSQICLVEYKGYYQSHCACYLIVVSVSEQDVTDLLSHFYFHT